MTNMVAEGKVVNIVCSHPAVPASGDPVRYGYMTGVAVVNESEGGSATGYTTVKVDGGIYDLSVLAENDSGASAVAVGDTLFFTDADTPHLSKKTSGYFFGIAMEAIAAGTATINVRHVQSPGVGTLAAGGVGNTQMAATHIQYATVAITNAQLKALRAAPKTLVAAPAAGYILKFLGGLLGLNYGSNVFTETADNLVVRYTDGTGVVVSNVVDSTGFIDAAADTYTSVVPVLDAIVAKSACSAAALVLHNNGDGEFGGNAGADTTVVAHIWYAVVPAIV